MIRWPMTAAALAAATPVLAHPGAHAAMDLRALAAHFFEPDHLIFAMLAAIIGVLAYRAGVKKGRCQ